MSTAGPITFTRREAGPNIWLDCAAESEIDHLPVYELRPEILETEEAVGRAMLGEIESAARAKEGDLSIILLGGRGGQAMHRMLGLMAQTGEADHLLSRLRVFTQDALAPMRTGNGLSFTRDFERLLGEAFFQKIKSFTPMRTDTQDPGEELRLYLEELESAGGVDIFFMGLGPEAGGASHLAYIKPGSGAMANDLAGLIPISSSILEHHVAKFRAGGGAFTEADEAECRSATHIFTLGPAAILGARRIVQSIVDAGTAPAKRESYRRLLEEEVWPDPAQRTTQLDDNPGLWLRLHPNVRSLILPDLLGAEH